MKRKNLFAVFACFLCLAVSGAAPAMVTAEETGGVEAVTEAQTGEQETAEAETDAEEPVSGDSAGTETEQETPVRPDYTASDYVTLGEYKGLTVVRDPAEVTEEEIDEQIRSQLQNSDAVETLTEGVVQEGDTANIDYEGKKDGTAFDGGTAEGYDLTIGSHTFIDGFEDGLIGVAVGDTVDLPLTFPENYGNEELAGQDVVFTVTVNEIRRAPELTDEVAGIVTDGEYNDAASYRESVRAQLLETREEQIESSLMGDLLTQIANTSEITGYPQEMVDYNVALMEQYYRSVAEMYSMEFEAFLSAYLDMTPEEFHDEAVLACQQILQQEMYLKAIAETEGLEISEEEYAEGTQRYAAEYGYETAEELIAANDEGELRISLLQDKVLDFLMDNANIVEAEPETETENMTEITGAELAMEQEEAQTGPDTEEPADEAETAETEAGTEMTAAETETEA